ncbi:hypothetical protein [uncultured Aliiroseovarius sp.]|uniref:hypothetical protein n=1 Tax=uncultured Aliiroseovarius sp. TaxID=1658783 RepID=UPI0026376A6C|nr:hypothetical protein [uncultured Aliiroseovarius sp.]
MTDTPARYDDPSFPIEGFHEAKARFSPELLDQIRGVSGIETNDDDLRHRLGKDLWRYQCAIRSVQEPIPAPQHRELKSLQKAAERLSNAIDRLNDINKLEIDDKIQHRAPFNGRFYFPEQLDYWAANENSTQRAQNLAKMLAWSVDRVFEDREAEKLPYKRTVNTPLDHLIADLTVAFQDGTGENPTRHCRYHPTKEAYTGRYYDFVLLILKNFAAKGFHSEVALGKRIVRILSNMNF